MYLDMADLSIELLSPLDEESESSIYIYPVVYFHSFLLGVSVPVSLFDRKE